MSTIYEDRRYAEGAAGGRQEDWHNIHARGRARHEREHKYDNEKAMAILMRVSGLKDSELLFEWYQHKFVELGAVEHEFEAGKLKTYTALLSLVVDRPFMTKLPIPNSWEHPLLESYYHLDDVRPWVTYHAELSRVDKEYDNYLRSWVGIKSGKKTHVPNSFSGKPEPVYLDPDFSLRLDLAVEFSAILLAKLKELLGLKKAGITETLRRNLDLADLLYDVSRYQGSMNEVLAIELKGELDSLKGDDPLSELCVKTITEVLKSGTFDRDDFEVQLIGLLWDQLLALQKTDEQREQVKLIRRAISGELYQGIEEVD